MSETRKDSPEQERGLSGDSAWNSLVDEANKESWDEHLRKANALVQDAEKEGGIGFKLSNHNLQMNASIEMTPDSGVLEVNDAELPINTVKTIEDPEQIFLVHSTDFFPDNNTILSNADGNKSVTFSDNIDLGLYVVKQIKSPRETVHFTMNGRVRNTGDGAGSWGDQKFIILEPFTNHQEELVSGGPHSGDNYVDGSMKLSGDAILMVREDAFDTLSDEQKQSYNIIKYSGDADACTKNLLYSLGVPVVDNEANDATHAHSEQYQQEYQLEKRAKIIKELANVELSKHQGADSLSKEDIAMLYREMLHDYDAEDPGADAIKTLAEKLGVRVELADFMLKNGVYRNGSGYALLSNELTKEYQGQPEWFIESATRNGRGFSELQDYIDNSTFDTYQESSLLEKNHRYEDISIGQLQTLQNYGTLKKLKDTLGVSNDKAIILREDGIYLGKEILGDTHTERSDDDVLLGDNSATIGEVVEKYQALNSTDI